MANEKYKEFIKITSVKKTKFSIVNLNIGKIGGGIYRMYNNSGEVIYVGKSSDLHRRLLQHYGKDTNTAYFIDEVTKAEWHLEDDPVYQTLLEAIFIAYHKPKYNDEIKDAKKKFGDDYA